MAKTKIVGVLDKGVKRTTVLACTCKNDWQDEKYGKGLRLMNKTGKLMVSYRCTVCGVIK